MCLRIWKATKEAHSTVKILHIEILQQEEEAFLKTFHLLWKNLIWIMEPLTKITCLNCQKRSMWAIWGITEYQAQTVQERIWGWTIQRKSLVQINNTLMTKWMTTQTISEIYRLIDTKFGITFKIKFNDLDRIFLKV